MTLSDYGVATSKNLFTKTITYTRGQRTWVVKPRGKNFELQDSASEGKLRFFLTIAQVHEYIIECILATK